MRRKHLLVQIFVLAIFSIISCAVSFSFESASSNHEFDFTVTSGKNNDLNSSNYETFVVVGALSGSGTSSNFNNRIGFLITNPFINGEACKTNAECKSAVCCSNLCAASCPSDSGNESDDDDDDDDDSGSSGGGSLYNSSYVAAPKSTHIQVFGEVKQGNAYTLAIKGISSSIMNVTFVTNEDLSSVEVRVSVITNVSTGLSDAYEYALIESKQLNTGNLETLDILFKVPIQSGTDPNSVGFYQLSATSWLELSRTYIDSDSSYYYFRAYPQTLGTFGIAIKNMQAPSQTRPPLQEVTGNVIRETQPTPKEQPTAQTKKDEKPIEEKKSSLMKWIMTLLGMTFLLVSVAGLYAYKLAQAAEERKMTYLQFNTLSKDIYRRISQNELQVAIILYKKLMPHYTFLMQAGKISPDDKVNINKEFRLLYQVLNNSMTQANFRVDSNFWKR